MRWAGHLLSQLLPRTRGLSTLSAWLNGWGLREQIGKKFLMQRLKITGPPKFVWHQAKLGSDTGTQLTPCQAPAL